MAGGDFQALGGEVGGDDGSLEGECFEDFQAGAAAGAQGGDDEVDVLVGGGGDGDRAEVTETGGGVQESAERVGCAATGDDKFAGSGDAEGGEDLGDEPAKGVLVGRVAEGAEEKDAQRGGGGGRGRRGGDGDYVGQDADGRVMQAGGVEGGGGVEAIEAGEEVAFEAGVGAGVGVFATRAGLVA